MYYQANSFSLKDFSNEALTEYFKQNAMMLSPHTIIEKSKMNDYEFFLSQANFLIVVDTLEKFQQGMVNAQSEEGKKFIHFKRSLYKLYEVRNRSTLEHDAFSFKVDRRSLTSLYRANLDYVAEVSMCNEQENRRNLRALKGKAFKKHRFGSENLRGLGAFTISGLTYYNWAYLALMLGNSIPFVTFFFPLIYGVHKFHYHNEIHAIEFVKGGDHDGWLKVTISESPFNSKDILVNPAHIESVGTYALDTESASDTKKHFVNISQYEQDGVTHVQDLIATVPEDAYRDNFTMDWILQSKSEDETETTALFNDLIHQDLKTKTIQAGSAGFLTDSRQASSEEIRLQIEKKKANQTLQKMEEVLGKEKLESMTPEQLYNSYRSFIEVQRVSN